MLKDVEICLSKIQRRQACIALRRSTKIIRSLLDNIYISIKNNINNLN